MTDWCDDYLSCRLEDRWLRLTRRDNHRIYGSRDALHSSSRLASQLKKVVRFRVGWPSGMMTISARLKSGSG